MTIYVVIYHDAYDGYDDMETLIVTTDVDMATEIYSRNQFKHDEIWIEVWKNNKRII